MPPKRHYDREATDVESTRRSKCRTRRLPYTRDSRVGLRELGGLTGLGAMREIRREQRRSPRVRSKGLVSLGDGAQWLHHRVLDLSVSGICTAGEADWAVGEQLTLDISFDAAPRTHYATTGRVRRASGETLAIELDAVPQGLETHIVQEIVAAIARDAEPNVILVDTRSPMRTAIADAFRNHGCVVTEVSTPLEAIRQLIADRFDPSIIAIADTLPESVAEELREFLTGEYPNTEMIAIGRSTVERAPIGSWIDSEDLDDDLDARVGAVVTLNNRRARPRTEH